MFRPLLATKLFMPPPRAGEIPRPHLLARLDEGLQQRRRLTLISAPAGFGKTTLVSAWLTNGAHPAAWVLLDTADNDPTSFLTLLIAALQQLHNDIGAAAARLLQAPQLPPLQSVVALLVNDLAALGTDAVLVLDDYHTITAPAIHQGVEFLLDNLPPTLHLVLLTREDPPFSRARLRARGQLTELRERDLRFSLQETQDFLMQSMHLSLSPAAVEALAGRTEGWIAGLQLAALALHEHAGDPEAFVAQFTGDDRYVIDYLVSEVLDHQPPEIRAFLQQTAVLERFNAALCDSITGRSDSRELLEQLDRANLFVIPLDHRREWYRYHHLFAAFLRTHLPDDTFARLHERASAWYVEQGAWVPAVQHALSAGALSGEWVLAERLLLDIGESLFFKGGMATLGIWLETLPPERVQALPLLALLKALALIMNGSMREIAPLLLAAPPVELRGAWLTTKSLLAIFGDHDYAQGVVLATEALRELDETEVNWRIMALWAQAESLEHTGRLHDAILAFQAARQSGLAIDNLLFTAAIEISLAIALNYQGQRRAAIAVCEEGIARLTDTQGRVSPGAAVHFSELGILHYDAGDLDLSAQCHAQAAALSAQLGIDAYRVVTAALAAQTTFAQGNTEAALQALEQAAQQSRHGGPGDAEWYQAMAAFLRLRRGDYQQHSGGIVFETQSEQHEPLHYSRIQSHLMRARLLLAQGQLDAAQARLTELEQFTRNEGLRRPLITVHILQALAAARLDDLPRAQQTLAEAVQLAAPENYLRLFLDEDADIIGLLPAVRSAAPAFVLRLLEAAGVSTPRPLVAASPLAEPLSEREVDVLRLVAEGLSNPEIAQRLYISTGTVKQHINHIYGKLAVSSRAQAIVRARAAGLLGEGST